MNPPDLGFYIGSEFPATLNDIDRRILRESIKVAHRIQQRLQLDYER